MQISVFQSWSVHNDIHPVQPGFAAYKPKKPGDPNTLLKSQGGFIDMKTLQREKLLTAN